jgi:hypothetical protein
MPRWDPKIASLLTAPHHWWMLMTGRLSPEVSEQGATAAVDTIFKQSTTEGFTPSPQDRDALASLDLAPGGLGMDELRRHFSRPLLILMGIFGLVLLIAWPNVANLLQARATARPTGDRHWALDGRVARPPDPPMADRKRSACIHRGRRGQRADVVG